MWEVMFTGGIIPRIKINDVDIQGYDLEWVEGQAKRVAEAIMPAYWWCGIFKDGKLVKEFNFGPSMVIK